MPEAVGWVIQVDLAGDGLPVRVRVSRGAGLFPPSEGIAAVLVEAFVTAHREQTIHALTTMNGAPVAGVVPGRAAGTSQGLPPPTRSASDHLDRVEAVASEVGRGRAGRVTGGSGDGRVQVGLRPPPTPDLTCTIDDRWAAQVGPARVEIALTEALNTARAQLASPSSPARADRLTTLVEELLDAINPAGQQQVAPELVGKRRGDTG